MLYFMSTIIPTCFVLAAVPERFQLNVKVPTAGAKTKIVISERRPQFEQQILEERRPHTQTHVHHDWFVLLDVGLRESGTTLGLLFADEPLTCFFAP